MHRVPTNRKPAPRPKRPPAAAETIPAAQYVNRPPGLTDPHAFALAVNGDSMQPEYRPGEVLVFNRTAPIRSGDDCLVVFYHPAWGLCERLKRVFLKPGGDVRLQALNPKYGSLTLEAYRVLATIRAVARVPAEAAARGMSA